MIQNISKDTFETQVAQASGPVLVELWAPWCTHCRRLAPVLERLSAKYGDALPIGKINLDEEPELGERLQADVIPALFLFRNGQHGAALVAPASQAQLESWLSEQGQ